MQRRDFLTTGALAAGAALTTGALQQTAALANQPPAGKPQPFKLRYAPHFGMFKAHAGDDLVAQLEFMADHGFTVLEDNGMGGRSVEDQERCAQAMQRLGMSMGTFVATKDFQKPSFASGKKDDLEPHLQAMRDSLDVAKRVNATVCTVVPGTFDHRLAMGFQMANVVEGLKRCAEICEPSGLVMVLEPLNHYANHPDLFLHLSDQTYLICKAVNSPSCKILFDIYHQQISEGNLIPNMDRCWDEIAYIQTGDNPGRKEPGTGEINYRNIFRHLHAKGYQGMIGMEHGNSIKGEEGELAVIKAYRDADDF